MLLALSLATVLAINVVLFVIAYMKQSDKLTDFAYSISFISVCVAALVATEHQSLLLTVSAVLVFIWALRLGVFLVLRIRKAGKDTRFDGIREKFWKFLQFWLAQGVVAWLLLLPLLFVAGHDAELTIVSVVGIVIWGIAFIIEVVADAQKYKFKQDVANAKHWIQTGLWRYSRHPNYFGEIGVWVGMYIIAFPVLDPVERTIALASPLAIYITLRFVSGIPILEKSADKKWGKTSEYRAYKKGTNLLIPFWSKKSI